MGTQAPKIIFEDRLVKVICGDVMDVLKDMPALSTQMVMYSPPYLMARDYQVEGQWGRESTPKQWIDRMLRVTWELRNIIRTDGSLWLNVGDKYDSGSLRMLPTRLVERMLDEQGWYLKNFIPWWKPNAFPDPVKNRLATTWEPVFFMTKVESDYKFHLDDVRLPTRHSPVSEAGAIKRGRKKKQSELPDIVADGPDSVSNPATRRLYSPDWRGYTHPDGANPGDMFVTPEAIPEYGTEEYRQWYFEQREKKAWHSHENDDVRGQRYELPKALTHPDGAAPGDFWPISTSSSSGLPHPHYATYPEELCIIPVLACTDPGDLVLDPFGGSGTTAVVAKKYGRRAITIDIDPKACENAVYRLMPIMPLEFAKEE